MVKSKSKSMRGVCRLLAWLLPAGLFFAPGGARAAGFLCGVNKSLTQNTRAQVSQTQREDRRTESKVIDRGKLKKALANRGSGLRRK